MAKARCNVRPLSSLTTHQVGFGKTPAAFSFFFLPSFLTCLFERGFIELPSFAQVGRERAAQRRSPGAAQEPLGDARKPFVVPVYFFFHHSMENCAFGMSFYPPRFGGGQPGG